MIYKQCGRCGKRLPAGIRCPCNQQVKRIRDREYDRQRRDKKVAAFYHSGEWQTLQRMAKEKFHGIDIYALYHCGVMMKGKIAHHIHPVRQSWEERTDVNNLIYVSEKSHYEIHERMKKGDPSIYEELLGMVKKWEKETHGG